MVELRVEDVKALKEAIGMIERNHLGFFDSRERVQLLLVADAARLWLASQATTEGRYVEPAGSSEQTPDYEAAKRVLAHRMSLPGGVTPEGDIRDIIDAALVGFHPQPEGDER